MRDVVILSVTNKPIMLSVFMLSVFMLSVFILSVLMLSVIVLSIVMLNAVEPFETPSMYGRVLFSI